MYPIVVQAYFGWNYDQSMLYVSERPKREAWRREHTCMWSLEACIDERVSDMVDKLGLMPGIPHVSRSPGCFESNVASPLHQKRHFAHHDMYCGSGQKMEVHMASYHFSAGSKLHGCAARSNKTDQYRDDMIQYAKAVNRASPGSVAFAGGWDTDLDDLIIHGPDGELVTLGYARAAEEPEDVLLRKLVEDLEKIFPRRRGLFEHKPGWMVDAFYQEFAAQLVHHIACIRQKLQTVDPNAPETEPHTGRLAFIGRPLDMEPPRGTAFLLEDLDPRLMEGYVKIPLKYVCMNAILAAQESGNDSDFVTPFVVSIPHRKGNKGFKEATSLAIARMIESVARASLPGIIAHFKEEDWWKRLPKSLQRIAENEAVERVCTFPCVHDQSTRLFVPVT